MSLHLSGTSLAEQMRLQQNHRRVDAACQGESVHGHPRSVQLHDLVFALVLVLSAIAGLVLLAA